MTKSGVSLNASSGATEHRDGILKSMLIASLSLFLFLGIPLAQVIRVCALDPQQQYLKHLSRVCGIQAAFFFNKGTLHCTATHESAKKTCNTLLLKCRT